MFLLIIYYSFTINQIPSEAYIGSSCHPGSSLMSSRMKAEGPNSVAVFIVQEPPKRTSDRHVKQPIMVHFVQRRVQGC